MKKIKLFCWWADSNSILLDSLNSLLRTKLSEIIKKEKK